MIVNNPSFFGLISWVGGKWGGVPLDCHEQDVALVILYLGFGYQTDQKQWSLNGTQFFWGMKQATNVW